MQWPFAGRAFPRGDPLPKATARSTSPFNQLVAN